MRKQAFIKPALSLLGFWLAAESAQAESAFWLSGALAENHLSGISSPTAPTLLSGSLSATLGYIFADHFLLGAVTSYAWTNQYSDTAPPVGNWRGTRWDPISPTVAIVLGPLVLQGDYEFLGSYHLGGDAADGSAISYDSPTGYTVSLAYELMSGFYVGMLYQHVSYATQDSSTGGDTALQQKFQMTEYGLTATFSLFPHGTGGQ